MDVLITVETEMFDHREVKPHFINPCCFGEDFAAWLKNEISPLADSGFSLSESIQEDYGCGFWASHGKVHDTFCVGPIPKNESEPAYVVGQLAFEMENLAQPRATPSEPTRTPPNPQSPVEPRRAP
jgi:hypothetical protein